MFGIPIKSLNLALMILVLLKCIRILQFYKTFIFWCFYYQNVNILQDLKLY